MSWEPATVTNYCIIIIIIIIIDVCYNFDVIHPVVLEIQVTQEVYKH
jgi:hypothetical protein